MLSELLHAWKPQVCPTQISVWSPIIRTAGSTLIRRWTGTAMASTIALRVLAKAPA
jgi:hypothetical protein